MNLRSTWYYYLGALIASLLFPFFCFYFLFLLLGGDDATAEKIITNEIGLVFFLFVILIVPVVALKYSKRKNSLDLLEFFSLSFIRYALAYLMFFYGTGKIFNRFFDITYLSQDTRLSELSSFYLTWYFFGRSTVQIILLGLLELIPAIMLLFRRTYFLGAVILLPMSANVFIVNTFNRLSPFTFLVSMVIFLGNIYLIYSRKEEIKAFFRLISETTNISPLNRYANYAGKVGKIIIIGAMIFFTLKSIYFKIRQKFEPTYNSINKITGGFELQSLHINSKPVQPKLGDKYYQHLYLEPQSRWNSIKTFEPNTGHTNIIVKWNAQNDSVKTFLKLFNDVGRNEVDSTSEFSGTYKLTDNRLIVKGIQHGDTIEAVYLKKKLTDYKWFW